MASGLMLSGTTKLIKNALPGIVNALQGRVEVVSAIADAIKNSARAAAPVDTGMLAVSIESRRQNKDTYWVYSNTRYAAYVEYGTKNNGGPQPYMTPSAEQHRADFLAQMKALVEGGV